METSELRNKSSDELRTELHDLLREQFNLRMQQGSGQLNRHHVMKNVRRNIARVMTVMNEQKRAGA